MIQGPGEAENQAWLQRCSDLVLKFNTPKGRGVFANKAIPAQTVIETCPVLVLDQAENREHIEKTSLYHYTYNWPVGDTTGQAVVLGLGSMFNHSSQDQNVGWQRDVQRQIITYKTLRDIDVGEELCISYGSRLTFVDTDAPKVHDEGDGTQMLNSIDLEV